MEEGIKSGELKIVPFIQELCVCVYMCKVCLSGSLEQSSLSESICIYTYIYKACLGVCWSLLHPPTVFIYVSVCERLG